jgi:hypothetical protein
VGFLDLSRQLNNPTRVPFARHARKSIVGKWMCEAGMNTAWTRLAHHRNRTTAGRHDDFHSMSQRQQSSPEQIEKGVRVLAQTLVTMAGR